MSFTATVTAPLSKPARSLQAHRSSVLSPQQLHTMNNTLDTTFDPTFDPAQFSFVEQYKSYKNAVEEALTTLINKPEPRTLYEPMRYILLGGGKRVRPVLAMMASAAVGGSGYDAMYAGIAVEILHNFTLIHDDIMDAAPMRRNMQTVHMKWNESAAILSGDGMMAVAYQVMMRSPNLTRLYELVEAMNTGIIEVCEGQAFDLEFQDHPRITLRDYFVMIEKKTAKMLELAVNVGGIIGDASDMELDALSKYALATGIAFQVQDDLLDIAAMDADKFGKTVGGDIVEGKKTYLVIRALEQIEALCEADKTLLIEFETNRGLPQDRVAEMHSLFDRNGIFADARAEVERLTKDAHDALAVLRDMPGRALLHEFATMLLERNH
jgi:geranylgeranyl diphosphate synthase, type II